MQVFNICTYILFALETQMLETIKNTEFITTRCAKIQFHVIQSRFLMDFNDELGTRESRQFKLTCHVEDRGRHV